MALGKRGLKHSPVASTALTTITFLVLCVLGVWMLAGKTFSPPKITTTTTTADTNTGDSGFSFSNEPETLKTTEKKDNTKIVFEDNPGVLPNDALQTGDPIQTSDGSDKQDKDREQGSSGSGGDTKISDEEKVKKIFEEQKKQKEGGTQISEEEGTLTAIENRQVQVEVGSNAKPLSNERQEEDARNEKLNINVPENHSSGSGIDNQKETIQHQEQQKQGTHIIDQAFPYQRLSPQQQVQVSNLSKSEEHENTEETEGKRTKEHKTNNSNAGQTSDTDGDNTGIPQESPESKNSWSTQASQSLYEKERLHEHESNGNESHVSSKSNENTNDYTWNLCNETAGPDFIPCLDNRKAIVQLSTTAHYEHRERHCPEMAPNCLVPLPEGYKTPIAWPESRDKVWFRNVPNPMLAQVKGHQNWVKVTGELLTFPGGGTQFIHGALHYIDLIQRAVPKIAWGKQTRVILDVGCGVASFGGYLFQKDVMTMSFAPKDEHEAQVQFALERGIPAISAVMGTMRLQFPSNVFDLVHCARCRVPWHVEGGKLLLELNRVLRPGGYFVWSATPVYQNHEEDVEIWKAMSNLTASMCWEIVTTKMDKLNSAGFAIYRKPTTNECYQKRNHSNPPMCNNDDDPNAALYVPLQACLHRVPVDKAQRGSRWPDPWPHRLEGAPYWLNSSQMGIYGRPAPQDFTRDYKYWKHVVNTSYMSELGISWSNVRNVMDMRAVYGGFAAALKDFQVWVMNVVNVNSPDTLPIIYERGLFGIYHDWCESFSTYPRTYDLLHADHLFSQLKDRCKLVPVMAEVDRVVRPGGKLIVRDESGAITEVENLLKSLHWEILFTSSKDQEGVLSAQKGNWRPDTYHQPAS